ncbi:7-carboxy-7-deazaguanine synthase [Mycobacteroides abscessus subsp. abscessus]|nr:7-carboxy-7-deazaguanine synthase [Mycobacteroides abscessus subsp. abscessus]
MTGALPLSEQFAGTIQGEGPYAGRACQFIRLGGCNLSCSWCDTPYTWDERRFDLARENPAVYVDEIIERAEPNLMMVISGGEPLMHQRKPAWERLLRGLRDKGCMIQIETNGTLPPNEITRQFVDAASISPKLANAGGHRRGQNPALHKAWPEFVNSGHSQLARNSVLKFVTASADDVDAAVAYADGYGWPRTQVWVMPQGTSVEELQSRWPAVARRAADLRINASHRIHVLAFGDTKGT